MTSKVDNDLRIDVFRYINQEFQTDFRVDKNVLGASDIFYGQKKLVYEKVNEIIKPPSMKQLFGTIMHKIVEYKPIRTKIVEYLNNQFGINGDPLSKAEIEEYYEILPNQFLRLHPDIYTPHYIIELKGTTINLRSWTREVAINHVQQLLTYCAHYKKGIGILLMINLNAFLTQSYNFDYVLDNYCYALQFKPNYTVFQDTLELIKFLFECINNEDYSNKKLVCPMFSWECKECVKSNYPIQEICGREVYKCQECKKKTFIELPQDLTKEFKEHPICEKCLHEINPHLKYVKYKLVNYKEKDS